MPQDAPPNGSALDPAPEGPWSRVAGMQAKLHRWAAADPGRWFDDLFNFVHDPATLIVAFARVAGTGREHSRRGRHYCRLGRAGGGRARVPGRPAGRPEGRLVPAAAGAGTADSQAGRVREAPQAGDPSPSRTGLSRLR